ncbi:MAG: stage II sporulation protein M [Candidatus Diapherotrites archaeon]|nr:stage II sporulation protein M [Candidatus Diapherotrites archaeon]
MVFESILGEAQIRRHPLYILFLSIAFSSISIWVSYFTFPESSSILSLAFVTIGMMPVMFSLFTVEEEEEAAHPGKAATFIERHFDIIAIYSWFLIGLIFSYSMWYVVLPQKEASFCLGEGICMAMPAKEKVFREQENTFSAFQSIRQGIATGKATDAIGGGGANFVDVFLLIFTNNASVFGLAVLFSFIFGAGAIFLLAWNGSFIGVVVGKEMLRSDVLSGMLIVVGLLPHGIPEFIAYFIGAIAGGIISAAISKKSYHKFEFEIIAKDVLVLIALAYAILLLGALIEAWIIVAG